MTANVYEPTVDSFSGPCYNQASPDSIFAPTPDNYSATGDNYSGYHDNYSDSSDNQAGYGSKYLLTDGI